MIHHYLYHYLSLFIIIYSIVSIGSFSAFAQCFAESFWQSGPQELQATSEARRDLFRGQAVCIFFGKPLGSFLFHHLPSSSILVSCVIIHLPSFASLIFLYMFRDNPKWIAQTELRQVTRVEHGTHHGFPKFPTMFFPRFFLRPPGCWKQLWSLGLPAEILGFGIWRLLLPAFGVQTSCNSKLRKWRWRRLALEWSGQNINHDIWHQISYILVSYILYCTILYQTMYHLGKPGAVG